MTKSLSFSHDRFFLIYRYHWTCGEVAISFYVLVITTSFFRHFGDSGDKIRCWRSKVCCSLIHADRIGTKNEGKHVVIDTKLTL